MENLVFGLIILALIPISTIIFCHMCSLYYIRLNRTFAQGRDTIESTAWLANLNFLAGRFHQMNEDQQARYLYILLNDARLYPRARPTATQQDIDTAMDDFLHDL